MEQDKFAAILPVLIGGLVNRIIEKTSLEENMAFNSLYNSKLYAAIEDKETGVWTFSVPKLFELYKIEQDTGELDFPEY